MTSKLDLTKPIRRKSDRAKAVVIERATNYIWVAVRDPHFLTWETWQISLPYKAEDFLENPNRVAR